MSNADRYHFEDFTRENHRRLVRLAREHYVFRTFADFRSDERFILWRHDVDFSVHGALRLARIEADEGVRTTYFLNLHSQFYNLLERDVADRVRDIAALGHPLGVHFDPHFYSMNDEAALEAALAPERSLLERLFGASFSVFSFHIADEFTQACRKPKYAGMINVNASYFQDDVGYCSDSNGYWRFRRLEDVLVAASDARLQVLTHPELWQNEVMSPRQRVQRCIDGRAESTRRWYEDILRRSGRENVDWL